MSNQTQIRLAGSGGQGMIMAGVILAEAAILDDKIAIQSQSYGPEARGGASKAEVIISNEEIDFPKVIEPDLVLSLTQEATMKYGNSLKEGGLLIIDEDILLPEGFESSRVIKVPILRTAKENVGRAIVANIVAVGFIAEFTQLVSRESVEKAVLGRVPKGTEPMNKKALSEGYALAQSVK